MQSGNDLAELWVPPSTDDGKRTFVQLFWELANRGPRGAVVDERTLLTVLGEGVPPSPVGPLAPNQLRTIRGTASKGRVIGRLVALDTGDRTESIANQALAEIPAATRTPSTSLRAKSEWASPLSLSVSSGKPQLTRSRTACTEFRCT